MKRSELKELIRESYRQILLERESPEKFYSRNKNSMIKSKVKPGIYTVTDSDGGGMYDIPQFNVKITKPMNEYEIALELARKLKYFSPWQYITLKPSKGSVEITLPIPPTTGHTMI
jgi:hypothetical protein